MVTLLRHFTPNLSTSLNNKGLTSLDHLNLSSVVNKRAKICCLVRKDLCFKSNQLITIDI